MSPGSWNFSTPKKRNDLAPAGAVQPFTVWITAAVTGFDRFLQARTAILVFPSGCPWNCRESDRALRNVKVQTTFRAVPR